MYQTYTPENLSVYYSQLYKLTTVVYTYRVSLPFGNLNSRYQCPIYCTVLIAYMAISYVYLYLLSIQLYTYVLAIYVQCTAIIDNQISIASQLAILKYMQISNVTIYQHQPMERQYHAVLVEQEWVMRETLVVSHVTLVMS